MRILTRVLTDSTKLLEIEHVWNSFIYNHNDNPFFLSGFIKQFMESCRTEGWNPLIVVISDNNNILGTAPLIIKKRFGITSARFLTNPAFSPDFIICENYRKIIVEHILNFLFKEMHCQFIDLALEANSPNLYPLVQECKANGISFIIRHAGGSIMGHRVIPINSAWKEFCAFRGRNFRRQLKRMERNMDSAGSWRIKRAENGNLGLDAVKRIFDVERMSWKQKWRAKKGRKFDEDLLMILKASEYTAKIEPKFKWSVWFLELNNQTIAYCLAIKYKRVAFFAKTSYDERYRNLSPGIFVTNESVREIFDEGQFNRIDFLTDLPHHRKWAQTCLRRVRIVMTKGFPSAIKFLIAYKPLSNILFNFSDLRSALFEASRI